MTVYYTSPRLGIGNTENRVMLSRSFSGQHGFKKRVSLFHFRILPNILTDTFLRKKGSCFTTKNDVPKRCSHSAAHISRYQHPSVKLLRLDRGIGGYGIYNSSDRICTHMRVWMVLMK